MDAIDFFFVGVVGDIVRGDIICFFPDEFFILL